MNNEVQSRPDAERPEGKDDIIVFFTRHEGKCVDCGAEFFKGSMIRVEKQQTLCLDCADLGHLEYLPRGDTALTRRATKHSPLRAVVVEWSRSRKRYERQGILVTREAIEQAETECLADADRRARQRDRAAVAREGQEVNYLAQVNVAIRQLFPSCPLATLAAIAAWTCQKYSGRVGRSAAARDFEADALRLAVVAHIRHVHTPYDQLLMKGEERRAAREQVREKIDTVLRAWEAAASSANRVV